LLNPGFNGCIDIESRCGNLRNTVRFLSTAYYCIACQRERVRVFTENEEGYGKCSYDNGNYHHYGDDGALTLRISRGIP